MTKMILKDICNPLFTTALLIVIETWKQPKGALADNWIQKMWYTERMDYYLPMKIVEILPFAIVWIKVEVIMVGEINQKVREK